MRGRPDQPFAPTRHFCNGMLLGPLTGQLVANPVLGKEPPIPLDPFPRVLSRASSLHLHD